MDVDEALLRRWPLSSRGTSAQTGAMGYRVLADITMVLHFAFLAYVAAGGYLAWRWPRAIWPHLLLAGWGLSTVAFTLDCPLTWAEDWARQQAGEPGPGGAFVDTYLTGVLYPAELLGLVQALVALSVVVSWVGAAVLRARSAGRGRAPAPRSSDEVGVPEQL